MQPTPKGTFCYRLWNEAFIDKDGSVFSCCRYKPAVLGNIYKNKLEDIYNNEMIQELRQKSLDGKLECFENCILLNKAKLGEPKKTVTINYATDLKRLKILFGEACNISCIMCWQDHKDKRSLDVTKLIENVDIKHFQDIELQGGETLLIPAAKSFFDHASSKGKKVSFLTNGLPINDEWAEKIARHSSFLYISINAATKETHELVNQGSRWELVLKSIQKIREAREKYRTDVKIKGHMTIVVENLNEIPLFIKTFRQLGFDEIDFGFDKKVPVYLRLYPFKKLRLRLQIRKAIRTSEYYRFMDLLALKNLSLM